MPQTEDMQIMPCDANHTLWFFPPTVDERKTTVIFYSILLYNLQRKKHTKKTTMPWSGERPQNMFLNYQMVVVAG